MITKEQGEKRQTHSEIILDLLVKAGSKGIPARDLAPVTWRFSARISDLRALGHNIETIGGRNEPAVYVYHLPSLDLCQPSLF